MYFTLTVFLCGCENSDNAPNNSYTLIKARDNSTIYRIKIPTTWTQKDLSQTNMTDTINPIAEFHIDNNIRVTIHNFPSEKNTDRIPVTAQISRWKKQFSQLNHSQTQPQAFSGYAGQLLEAEGIQNSKEITVIGWSMQLAPEHYRMLHNANQKGDFTIKIVGPTDLMLKHKNDFLTFGRSFELIEEIPERL